MMPANRRIHPASYQHNDRVERTAEGENGLPSPATSRWASTLRVGAGLALVVSVSVGAVWLARRYVTTSPRFAVSSVQVVGNARRRSDAIAAESGLVRGANVFSIDLDAARANILVDPWIADVILTRRLPGTIVVQVTERAASAIVAIGDLFLAASDGQPFKKLEPGDPADLPLISGLTPESVANDRSGAELTIRRGIEVASEYDQCALARRASLEEVHVGENGDFTLVVGHSAIELALGGPPYRRKLDQAARVMSELDKRHAQASAIMLDNEARPDRVVARIASRP